MILNGNLFLFRGKTGAPPIGSPHFICISRPISLSLGLLRVHEVNPSKSLVAAGRNPRALVAQWLERNIGNVEVASSILAKGF